MPDWVVDFPGYVRKQWTDLTYAQAGGESIVQVQARYQAFMQSLPQDGVVAVGTHGTAMSSVVEMIWPGHGAPFFSALRFADVIRVNIQARKLVSLMASRPFSVLGQTMTVAIDQPLGKAYQERAQLIYPVNCGKVTQIVGGNVEKQDAYVLGQKYRCHPGLETFRQ